LSGIDVSVGIAKEECLKLNRRFFKSIKTGNPYIILKWAESSDHFVDINRDSNKINPIQISSIPSRSLLHSWRAKEEAILIGMKTFILDEPLLNVRYSKGPDPKKILWLSDNRPSSKNILDNAKKNGWIVWTINKNENQVDALRRNLNKCQFRSILVEGGTDTINLFLNNNLWDECRIIRNEKIYLEDGVKAPISPENWSTSKSYTVEDDRISIFKKL
jgi:diaminohydroxyphosphoribosylaminopyrimidine deaminase/5-amino-6-(5-phosphoribosylamino)uracil reductase